MFGRLDLVRGLRRLHWFRSRDPVEDELRGWSWERPPVRPRGYLGLGVSEVAYRYCPTRRDLWLRRVKGVVGEARGPVLKGRLVHEVFHMAARDSRRMLALGVSGWEAYERLAARAWRRVREACSEDWCIRLYKHLVLTWTSEAARAEAIMGGEGVMSLPWLTEFRIDGSMLGLSNQLRVDALGEASVIVEIKYGRQGDFHKVGLAGYALAFEASLEVPVDYGVLIYVDKVEARTPRVRVEPVYISPALRREFLISRDEAIDIISGPEPQLPPSCPTYCPYREVCRP